MVRVIMDWLLLVVAFAAAFLMMFLVVGWVRGGGSECEAAAALALSAAANGAGSGPCQDVPATGAFHVRHADPLVTQPTRYRTLAAARRAALAQRKPLIVWKGRAICPACVAGDVEVEFIHFVGSQTTLPKTPASSLVVFAPRNGKLVQVAVKTTWTKGHLPTVRTELRRWRNNGSVSPRSGVGRSSPVSTARPVSWAPVARAPAVFRGGRAGGC